MVKSLISKSPAQTKKLGKVLARDFLKKKSKKARVLALIGELGGGKTTFLQGLAEGLGAKSRILSPTFVIMRRSKIRNSRFRDFYHIDCYRIRGTKEILSLGFKKIISNPRNIVAIEWADNIKKALPRGLMTLKLDFIDEKTRKITLIK